MPRLRLLAFGLLALGAALANFVARIALANHIDSTASAHDLAIWVTEFQGTDGGYHFHDGCFSYRMVGKLNCKNAGLTRKAENLRASTGSASRLSVRLFTPQALNFAPQESRILGFWPNFATPNSDPWTTLQRRLRFGHVKRTQS
jgi:hypothetical protein